MNCGNFMRRDLTAVNGYTEKREFFRNISLLILTNPPSWSIIIKGIMSAVRQETYGGNYS